MGNIPIVKYGALAIAAIAVGSLIIVGVNLDRAARMGAGYKAKIACSEIFLAGRDPVDVLSTDFENITDALSRISLRINDSEQTISAHGPLGLGRINAAYREGYGCTLASGGRIAPLDPIAPPDARDATALARANDSTTLSFVDYDQIDRILDAAFADEKAGNRAFLVMVDGKIVAERYGDGFSETTPLLSWSMGKSIMATAIGAAVQDRLINIDDTITPPEWSDVQRKKITWRHLLQMQSGLEFDENYRDPKADAMRMLFEARDAAGVALAKPAQYAAGDYWSYSSGTTNLLSYFLKRELDAVGIDYHSYPREKIFYPIGATSTVIEPDPTGVFIFSSFVYATARDWGLLGQLYLNDGEWQGQQILPKGWRDFVSQPAEKSDGQYGGQFWLNRDGAGERNRFFPALPENVYFMSGHEGQFVIMAPDKNMVLIRLGTTRGQSPMETAAPVLGALYETVKRP